MLTNRRRQGRRTDCALIWGSAGLPSCSRFRQVSMSQIERLGGIAALVLPEGHSTLTYTGGQLPPPWAEQQVNRARSNASIFAFHYSPSASHRMTSGDQNPRMHFFGDLPEDSQLKRAAELQPASPNDCTTVHCCALAGPGMYDRLAM